MNKPVVWTIAGFDPTGYAGILADLETFKYLQVLAGAIVTAVTAQNSFSVTAIEAISSAHVAAQCAALTGDLKPSAIKIGMLGSISTMEILGEFLQNYSGSVVLDPVLISSSGSPLFVTDTQQHIAKLMQLFPVVDVLTPNIHEAENLLQYRINSYVKMQQAAAELMTLGVNSVLLKGGHQHDSTISQDYWTNGKQHFWMANRRLPEKNYRGTGCTQSSAIAAAIAQGNTLKDALILAKSYVHRGIRQAVALDKQTAQLAHGGWPKEPQDIPFVGTIPFNEINHA